MIAIFAKAPLPGRAKTRLIPALGPEGAARLAQRMLLETYAGAVAAGVGEPLLCTDPAPGDPAWDGLLPPGAARLMAQGDGDLGERLARVAAAVLASDPVLLIGTDCPDLGPERLRAAQEALQSHDAVIHPARDGGYALLGLRRFDPSLFSDIAWSTDTVAAETIARIRSLGWSLDLRESLRDVDEPADLDHLPPDYGFRLADAVSNRRA